MGLLSRCLPPPAAGEAEEKSRNFNVEVVEKSNP